MLAEACSFPQGLAVPIALALGGSGLGGPGTARRAGSSAASARAKGPGAATRRGDARSTAQARGESGERGAREKPWGRGPGGPPSLTRCRKLRRSRSGGAAAMIQSPPGLPRFRQARAFQSLRGSGSAGQSLAVGRALRLAS